MSLNEITWKDLSRYRGELMGAAIIFIVLFHMSLPRSDAFFGLRRCGNIGVDMFLFPEWYWTVVLMGKESVYQTVL